MIVNADRKVAPFYFVSETVWGGEVSNKPPIVLVHDGAHSGNARKKTFFFREVFPNPKYGNL